MHIESDDVDASNKKPGRKPMADEESLSDVSSHALQFGFCLTKM